MKISTKGRYALRLMIDITQHCNEKPVSIKEAAKRQNISDKYLEQIRGPHGGYLLKKAPKDYTVGMILRLTEGSLAPVTCVEEDADSCERKSNCATFVVWQKMYDAICDVVDNITLEDLVSWHIEGSGDYCI